MSYDLFNGDLFNFSHFLHGERAIYLKNSPMQMNIFFFSIASFDKLKKRILFLVRRLLSSTVYKHSITVIATRIVCRLVIVAVGVVVVFLFAVSTFQSPSFLVSSLHFPLLFIYSNHRINEYKSIDFCLGSSLLKHVNSFDKAIHMVEKIVYLTSQIKKINTILFLYIQPIFGAVSKHWRLFQTM